MICDRIAGTFKGTIAELHQLARKHGGIICIMPNAKVNSTTYVLVNAHGQIFSLNDPTGKYGRIGDCRGGTFV